MTPAMGRRRQGSKGRRRAESEGEVGVGKNEKSQEPDDQIKLLTSDLKSSDFVLAVSALFICPCSSSSLLMDGVLPFDIERTAGGAVAASREGWFGFFFLFLIVTTGTNCCCSGS